MQITITLKQLKDFLGRLPSVRRLALIEAREELEKTFREDVMAQNHENVFEISTKNEMKHLIRTGGTPKKAKPYNEEYLAKKRKYGEFSPHKFLDYGFHMGTEVDYDSGRVVMKTTHKEKRGFDYLAYHETQRSVLKLTFVKAWQKLRDRIVKKYAEEAQK